MTIQNRPHQSSFKEGISALLGFTDVVKDVAVLDTVTILKEHGFLALIARYTNDERLDALLRKFDSLQDVDDQYNVLEGLLRSSAMMLERLAEPGSSTSLQENIDYLNEEFEGIDLWVPTEKEMPNSYEDNLVVTSRLYPGVVLVYDRDFHQDLLLHVLTVDESFSPKSFFEEKKNSHTFGDMKTFKGVKSVIRYGFKDETAEVL